MADMIKRKDFQENEVVDLTEEIKQTSPSGFCRTKVRRGSNLSLYLILRYRSNY